MSIVRCTSPIDNSLIMEINELSKSKIEESLSKSLVAQITWRDLKVSQRANYLKKMLSYFKANRKEIAEEITLQMGRPICQSQGEINGMIDRAEYMISIAADALSDIKLPLKPGLKRYIRHRAVGTVLIIAPWNYPYLTAINSIVPALLSGNSVILKHASQTPLCGQRLSAAFKFAGLPDGVFQNLFMSHQNTEKLIADHRIKAISFTGSVPVGRRIHSLTCNRFINKNLELGGKDPAYVLKDADIKKAAENLVGGAFFNSGQSCCGVERIYVDKSIHDSFVSHFVEHTNKLVLGDPRKNETTLGPMVNISGAHMIRNQIKEAIERGATPLISGDRVCSFGENYVPPQVLINVNHNMSLMKEENFGPVVGIMAVNSDKEALQLINDSNYGLTASLWTRDISKGESLCNYIEAGTCFVNQCDYLDPGLAWTGVKDTGMGCSLSVLGFKSFTQASSNYIKSF